MRYIEVDAEAVLRRDGDPFRQGPQVLFGEDEEGRRGAEVVGGGEIEEEGILEIRPAGGPDGGDARHGYAQQSQKIDHAPLLPGKLGPVEPVAQQQQGDVVEEEGVIDLPGQGSQQAAMLRQQKLSQLHQPGEQGADCKAHQKKLIRQSVIPGDLLQEGQGQVNAAQKGQIPQMVVAGNQAVQGQLPGVEGIDPGPDQKAHRHPGDIAAQGGLQLRFPGQEQRAGDHDKNRHRPAHQTVPKRQHLPFGDGVADGEPALGRRVHQHHRSRGEEPEPFKIGGLGFR